MTKDETSIDRLTFQYCPKCDSQRRFGKFCRTCGSILIPTLPEPRCSCGEEIGEYDNYCRWCGKEVEE